MSPILGIWASQNYVRVTNSYESISTVTLGGTQATISFSSIPSTYKHLQVRYSGLSGSMGSMFARINGDTSAANYVTHYLTGNGSAVSAGGLPSNSGRTGMVLGGIGGGQFSTTYPYVGIIDYLDYTNTNKNHVVRSLHGTDTNNTGNGGAVGLVSGLHLSTTTISSLDFFLDGGVSFTANTKFALYGIKG